jgi:cyclopropane-fatty-acyl-phospholipid synthase
MAPLLDTLLKTNLVPDSAIRWGIRRLLERKLAMETSEKGNKVDDAVTHFANELRQLPIAINTNDANTQHYEVPPEFYELVLGPRLKYSSGYFTRPENTLAEAEEAMLNLYVERAGITDGMRILDLGCGWGSLSLYLAERFPNATIVGLSNSTTQRPHILANAEKSGITNLSIRTANISIDNPAEFSEQPFDRIVSIEMFEHMKNYEALLGKLANWLTPEGKLFVHIFTHKNYAYHYEDGDATDWMTRYFFSGGTMPSDNLLSHFQKDLRLTQQWVVNGTHYQLTSEAWLANMDANKAKVWPLLEKTYGDAAQWWAYWRTFFMACAELWGYDNGNEWRVCHYLFEKP